MARIIVVDQRSPTNYKEASLAGFLSSFVWYFEADWSYKLDNNGISIDQEKTS